MQFTTIVATLLSMAVFATAAPVAAGRFFTFARDGVEGANSTQTSVPARTTACASRALPVPLSRSPTARYDTRNAEGKIMDGRGQEEELACSGVVRYALHAQSYVYQRS
jgi:hypothetical protein